MGGWGDFGSAHGCLDAGKLLDVQLEALHEHVKQFHSKAPRCAGAVAAADAACLSCRRARQGAGKGGWGRGRAATAVLPRALLQVEEFTREPTVVYLLFIRSAGRSCFVHCATHERCSVMVKMYFTLGLFCRCLAPSLRLYITGPLTRREAYHFLLSMIMKPCHYWLQLLPRQQCCCCCHSHCWQQCRS